MTRTRSVERGFRVGSDATGLSEKGSAQMVPHVQTGETSTEQA
jgi:hypothetical protein